MKRLMVWTNVSQWQNREGTCGFSSILANPRRTLLLAYLQKSNPIHKSYALKILKAFGGFTSNRQFYE